MSYLQQTCLRFASGLMFSIVIYFYLFNVPKIVICLPVCFNHLLTCDVMHSYESTVFFYSLNYCHYLDIDYN